MVSKNTEQINFTIDHNDSLGQGVAKNLDQVVFIPKTLPEETGMAQIVKSHKGVSFANLLEIHKTSSDRISPKCEHFNQCGGCHYLHTSYENEIKIKQINLQRLLKKYLGDSELEIIRATNRFHYRNRIQLHYNKRAKLLGFFKTLSRKIVPVPSCIIAVKEIQLEIQKLYNNQHWLKLVANKPDKGTIEIYYYDGKARIEINGNRAHLGFTQVNQEMNIYLKNWVRNHHSSKNFTLELFGGDGNLTKHIDQKTKLIVDRYDPKLEIEDHFVNQDIYQDQAISNISKRTPVKTINLLLDPPRSGLKNIEQWTRHFDVKEILYISCNPSTFRRDIDSISSRIKSSKIIGIDLFPGTYHMEIASHFILH